MIYLVAAVAQGQGKPHGEMRTFSLIKPPALGRSPVWLVPIDCTQLSGAIRSDKIVEHGSRGGRREGGPHRKYRPRIRLRTGHDGI